MNDLNHILEEQKSNTLQILYNQIASFDNKASIIISILGIVFALSFTVIDIINEKDISIKPYVFSSFILFLISIMFSFFFSIMVFAPRKRIDKENKKKSLTYYEDLKIMTEREYKELFNSHDNVGASFEQIKQNAIICSKKHKNLTISIYLLVPIVFFFLSTVVLIIWL
ncbi:MAG: Pycsar system effector family protein [Acholeplasmataceae bacterium]